MGFFQSSIFNMSMPGLGDIGGNNSEQFLFLPIETVKAGDVGRRGMSSPNKIIFQQCKFEEPLQNTLKNYLSPS